MLFTIFGVFMALLSTIGLVVFAADGDEWYNLIAGILAIIMGAFSALGILGIIIFAWDWKAAEYQANIINREYGTNYTQEEIFYAKDVIDTIQEIARERIEINGDILHTAPKKNNKLID